MLTPGCVIDRKYRIVRIIGNGGMSTVYLAVHEQLQEKRAIKEIRQGSEDSQGLIWQRLISEVHILKKLNHPALPTIMDVIQNDKNILVIMEYVEGITLEEKMQREGVMDEKEARRIAIQLVEVLKYLHDREPPIIHGDLKPSNLMLRSDGRLTLLDFGTAKEYQREKFTDMVCLGTRGYAAPEQYHSGVRIDEKTDIYCFGATLYHLVTGKSLSVLPDKSYKIGQWNPKLTQDLKNIILKCTQEDPQKRYPDCRALQLDLMRVEKKREGAYPWIKCGKIPGTMIVVFLFGITILNGMGVYRKYYRNQELEQYVRMAERALDPEKIAGNYKKALQIDPGNRMVYESIVECFVQPEEFSVTKAASMINILDDAGTQKPVLEIFRREDEEGYGKFCYRVGIGYFYDMGDVNGKKESGIWFESASHTEKISKEMRKRAELYARISKYYKTFIGTSTVRDGEEGYQEFYNTLHELNQITLGEDSEESEVAAAYQISQEVAVEIGNYAPDFLRKTSAGYVDLLEELNQIMYAGGDSKSRIEYLSQYYEEKNIERLKMIVNDARKKVGLAENHNRRGGE